MTRFQNKGIASCTKCFRNFKENDIVATSTTSKHYCYKCATQINLVTGKVKIDLHNDEFIPKILYHIKSIGKKLDIDKYVCKLATLLVTTAFDNTNYVSKNKIGLACAAIFLACKIKRQSISNIDLPVSKRTLQKNVGLLEKNMTDKKDIYTLSRNIYELMH